MVLGNTIRAETLRNYMDKHRLTSDQVGALCRVNPRNVRHWADRRRRENMPYSVWHTLKCKTGECPSE